MMGFFGGGRKNGGAESRSLAEARFAVIDLELTGLSPGRDSIVSMGGVTMAGGRIEVGNTFYTLVRPRTDLRAESIKIHEITPDEAAAGLGAEEAMDRFLEFVGDRIVVGHCVVIDKAFLDRELKRQGKGSLESTVLDTMSLYRSLRGSRSSALLDSLPLEGVDLYAIARALGVQVRSAHNALADAYVTAQVFQRFLSILAAGRDPGDSGPGSRADLDLEHVLSAGNPSQRGFRYTPAFNL